MAKNGNGNKTANLAVVGKPPSDLAVADPISAALRAAAGAVPSKRLEDNVLPLVRLLQSNSPEVGTRNAAYVKGAVAGDWYFRDAPQEIVSGETGFEMQPLITDHHVWVQWKPDRGGFAGKTYPFNDPPPEAADRTDVDPETGASRIVKGMPNGDYLEETIYIYGLVNGRLWVIPCRSTGLTVARRFNQALGYLQVMDKERGEMVDLMTFGSTWRFTTRLMSNKKGEWFVPNFTKLTQFANPGDELNVPMMDYKTFMKGLNEWSGLVRDLKTGARIIEIAPQDETGIGGPKTITPTANGASDEDIPF